MEKIIFNYMNFLFLAISILPTTALADDKCYKIGQKVTVRGYADAYTNGGTYFRPLNPMCVDFPPDVYNGKRFKDLSHLTTLEGKAPPNLIIDISGVLKDPYPIHGVGIEITNMRNVDAEVRQKIATVKARWDHKCEEWRQENRALLKEQTLGGRVSPIGANDKVDIVSLAYNLNRKDRCGLMAVFPKTHKIVKSWMPDLYLEPIRW